MDLALINLQRLIGHKLQQTKSKIVLDTSLLDTQHYKVRMKSKCYNPGKAVVPFPKLRCSSYCKESLLIALHVDLAKLYIYI